MDYNLILLTLEAFSAHFSRVPRHLVQVLLLQQPSTQNMQPTLVNKSLGHLFQIKKFLCQRFVDCLLLLCALQQPLFLMWNGILRTLLSFKYGWTYWCAMHRHFDLIQHSSKSRCIGKPRHRLRPGEYIKLIQASKMSIRLGYVNYRCHRYFDIGIGIKNRLPKVYSDTDRERYFTLTFIYIIAISFVITANNFSS